MSPAPFACVVADPPWRFGDSLPGKKRGAAKHYRVMGTGAICGLQLPPIADAALLFLWRVEAMMDDALQVARAWGFEPKSKLTWVKVPNRTLVRDRILPKGITAEAMANLVPLSFGMGRYTRASSEDCMICARGKAAGLILNRSIRSVFFAPRGIHSQKPDAFYAIVERLCPGPRVELFARREREGWTTIGDALGTELVQKETP